MKVLVIDDQPPLRDLFAEFLALLGHAADLAAGGHEGLARFDPLVHQVVLTDNNACPVGQRIPAVRREDGAGKDLRLCPACADLGAKSG